MNNTDWLKFVLENTQTPEGMGRATLAGGTKYDLSGTYYDPTKAPTGIKETPQNVNLQPSGKGGNDWLKNIFKVIAPLAAGALMSYEARPPDAPHGGTIGSKPALAQAFGAMSNALTQKQKAEDLIKAEIAEQQHRKVMEDLQRESMEIKKFLAQLNLDKFLSELPKTEAETADIIEKTRGRKVSTDILEETGYKPGSRGLNIRVGGQSAKDQKVDSLDQRIYNLLNKISYQSPNYSVFNDLQGATNEQELDVIYRKYASTLPVTEMYGGTKANLDALYRFLKERFRIRPQNVPEVEITGEIPTMGAGINPTDEFGVGSDAQSIVDAYFGE